MTFAVDIENFQLYLHENNNVYENFKIIYNLNTNQNIKFIFVEQQNTLTNKQLRLLAYRYLYFEYYKSGTC